MSGSQLPASSSQSHSLSEAASDLVRRVPQLLRRLRDLEDEEAGLDAQARRLMGQLPPTNDRPSTPIAPTPASKSAVQATESTVDRSVPSTPAHIDPSIYVFLGLLNKTFNKFGRKPRNACEGPSVDGVARVNNVSQK